MAAKAFDLRVPAVRALREKIALGCRILAKLELVDYLGHVSARVPDAEFVLIRARGAEQGNQLHMTYKQVTLVDLEAQQVAGKFPPPDETKLHTEIYKARPDVTAIVHTHQGLTTVFGDLERPILPMQGVTASVLAQVGQEIPIYRSSRKVTTTEQGVAVADSGECELEPVLEVGRRRHDDHAAAPARQRRAQRTHRLCRREDVALGGHREL